MHHIAKFGFLSKVLSGFLILTFLFPASLVFAQENDSILTAPAISNPIGSFGVSDTKPSQGSMVNAGQAITSGIPPLTPLTPITPVVPVSPISPIAPDSSSGGHGILPEPASPTSPTTPINPTVGIPENMMPDSEANVMTDDEGGGVGELIEDGATREIDTTDQGIHPIKTDLSSGALSFSYPFELPPGRNGLTPSLALTYNSNEQNNDGHIGYGWNLNIPSIDRVNKHGSDKLYDYYDFNSSLSGELVAISTSTSATSTFSAKVDTGEFLKYYLTANKTWVVYDKTGTRYTFGPTTDSRQDDPDNSSRIYKWMLQEIRDTNDNYIKYEYSKDQGQIYPEKITYTGHGSTDGIFEVDFTLAHHVPNLTMYYADFPIKTDYRFEDIQVKQNGEWVKKYTFGYLDKPGHRLLLSMTDSARDLDSGAVVTKAPTSFMYQTANPINWTASPTDWHLPHWLVDVNGTPSLMQIRDVNGDAYPDVVYRREDSSQTCPDDMATWINDTHGGWNVDCNEWIAPRDISNAGQYRYRDNGIRAFDYNGDQLVDFLYAYVAYGTSTATGGAVYKNTLNPTNGATWPLTDYTNQPGFIFGATTHGDNATEVVDINGDGIQDIVYGTVSDDYGFPPPVFKRTFIGDGATWATSTSGWNLPWGIVDENPNGIETFTNAQFVDLNGDGLNDFVFKHEDTDIGSKIGINNGHDWFTPTGTATYSIPLNTEADNYLSSGRSDAGTRTFDVNGDGLSDMVVSVPGWHGIYLNILQDGMPFTELAEPPSFLNFADSGARTQPTTIVDINADGVDDLITAKGISGAGHPFSASTYLSDATPFTDLLVGIKTSEGASTTVGYKMSTKYFDSNNDLRNAHLPIPVKTVNTITTNDGFNNYATTTYSYADGSYYYSSPTDRKFAGFGEVDETDPAGNVTKTYFHQGNTSASSTGEYDDHISKAGKPYRVERYDSSGNLYSKTIQKWDRADLGNDASFVKLADSVEFSYDGDGDHKEKASHFEYNNSTGNVSQKIDYGEVNGSNDGSYSDTGSDLFTTTIAYATSTSTSVPYLYVSDQQTVTNQSATKISEQKTYYDSQSLGTVVKGNPTKTEYWKSGSSYIDTEKTFNSYGLVTQEKDPRDKATNYDYDTYNLYPATTTNPLSQKTVAIYNYAIGKPKQITDANGYVFQTAYDGFGRVVEEKQPDLTTPTSLVTKAIYEYVDTGSLPRMAHKKSYLNSATSTDSYSYADGFGRVIQERGEAEDSNTFSVKDTSYNSIGKVLKESLPYFGTGASSTAATTTSALFVNYTYDPLYRVKTITNAVGSSTNAYDDWKTTVTDPDSKVKNLYNDAYGNLVKVDEINATSTYTTNYEYDGNKNLTKITDALGNIRNFTYDGLGRRLTAEDLHDSSDSYYGTWTYVYDDAGNLTSVTDPNNQNILYTYDDINRQTVENYAAGAGNEVVYGYDTCAGGVGKLCSATSSALIINNDYNALGGIKKEVKKFSVSAYTAAYTYDRLGNMVTAVLPDTSTTTNIYNTAGQLEKIYWQGADDVSPGLVVEDFDYGPTGRVTYQKDHNGVETTNTYDAAKMYRLTKKLTVGVDPDAGTHTVRIYAGQGDGFIINEDFGFGWSGARGGTYGAYSESTSSSGPFAYSDEYPPLGPSTYSIGRGFYTFDTSQIPDNAVVSSSTLGIYVRSSNFSDTDNDGNDFVGIVQTSQASSTRLNDEDFDQIGVTEGASRVDFGSLVLDRVNTFSLNNTGLSWIKKSGQTSNCGTVTGWTCLGTREGHDLVNSAISNNTTNVVYSYFSEASGTTTDPYLDIQYVVPQPTIQDIRYTYSAAGDITNLAEYASTSAYRSMTYQYDDLHRLTRASSTNATSNYLETYSYNALGNIANKSDQGNYSYAGNTGTLYANPHAATTIGSTGLTYDKNGNLLSFGSQKNTWDYNNRLSSTFNGTATSTATYDPSGERASFTDSSGTTRYLNQFYSYNITDSVPTRYIFGNGQLVATIEDSAEDLLDGMTMSQGGLDEGMTTNDFGEYNPPKVPTIHYIHDDHLSGSNVVTDKDGALEETLDYLPFGALRLDNSTGAFKEIHKYIGQIYDDDSQLSYLNARYLNGKTGAFLSQDPVFWEAGQTKDGRVALLNPQSLNSYSYAGNNPISQKDPTGRVLDTILDIGFIGYDIYSIAKDISRGQSTKGDFAALGLDTAGAAIPGVTGLGMMARMNEVGRTAKIANEVREGGESIVKFGVEYARSTGIKMTERGWSAGKIGDGLGNLVEHYFKHGEEVGAKSAGEYYAKANEIINSVDGKNVFKVDGLYSHGSIDYFDKSTNSLVGLNSRGEISTFHKVTNPGKLSGILKALHP